MNETVAMLISALVCALLFVLMTEKSLGAMQQAGYSNHKFLRWLRGKHNMLFNRLSVLSLCLALATAIVSLCFSFLGTGYAVVISSIPFFALCLYYLYSDKKYALKLPVKYTGRVKRLFVGYLFIVACVSYAMLAVLRFLFLISGWYYHGLFAFVPFAVMPMTLPVCLCLANAILSLFENARNRKFIKRAGQVLNEKQIIRVAVVGSYGKTSVKNILATLLSEKYQTVKTQASFNTPMGIAKTVMQQEFETSEVFVAEMGARKTGDIKELCETVKPDFAVFTGVCNQHLETFGSLEAVLNEKSRILDYAKTVVCGASLKGKIHRENALFVDEQAVGNLRLFATATHFNLRIGDETVSVETSLLGESAVENISLAVTLAVEMGLTAEEIKRGLSKLQPIPHRLQLIKSGGAYVIDDGYNANPKGAKEAIKALCRFDGRKCIVTPGLIECGVLEEAINGELGQEIAKANLDKVILVGATLVMAVKNGYQQAGGIMENLQVVPTLEKAQTLLSSWVASGDAVLFLNDLPDVY